MRDILIYLITTFFHNYVIPPMHIRISHIDSMYVHDSAIPF